MIFGTRKLVMGLSCGVISVILHLAVLIQYRSVTDRQTDRQTRDDAYTALSIASRGKNVSRDVTTPLSERFVVRRLGLATVNLYIKYEVSMFTHYNEDMKGNKKCKNWGDLGLGITQTTPHDIAP